MRLKRRPHCAQAKGLAPLWALECATRLGREPKRRPHCAQAKGRSPLCTRWCRARCCPWAKPRPQSGHKKDLSLAGAPWGAGMFRCTQANGSAAAGSTVAPSAHSSHPKGRPSLRCRRWCVARFFFQPKLRPQSEQAKGFGPGGGGVREGEEEPGEVGASGEGGTRAANACTLWCRTKCCLCVKLRVHCPHW